MKMNNLLTFRNIVVAVLLLLSFYSGYYFISNYTIEATSEAIGSNLPSSTDTHMDLGQISMKEGNVQLQYVFENTTGEPLQLNNLYTSCMCTKAKLAVNGKETPYAGMKGHTSGLMPINPNVTLNPGEKAELLVEFDPNAHGPQGTGPMTRAVVIETNNRIKPMMEFTFSGVVVQ